ncbi:MAG: histidine phosphatase family protein [Planctomycetes bacterium]|nr:histidine phosphatase family protein [Planctomycetota bacterium]
MSEIVLIRPGCTDFDEQKRIQGTLDLPLNSRGQEQVQQLVEQLHDIPLEAIYTSESDPAKATAEAIGDSLAVPVKINEGLINLNQGLWQGLQVDEVRRKYPKAFKQWQESPETICPPEGETISDALIRIKKTIKKPIKRHKVFGIVASEPLMSLISCLIENREMEIPVSCVCVDEPQSIEILHTPDDKPAKKGVEKKSPTADPAKETKPVVPATTSKSASSQSSKQGDNS